MIIYKCTFPNSKVYIGQTKRTLYERQNEHKRHSNNKNSPLYNTPIYNAIRKYGYENLEWEIIDSANSQEELDNKERHWIEIYNSYLYSENSNGYNLDTGGVGGKTLSEESKNDIRLANLGENNSNAKLTKDDVMEIIKMSNNKYSQVELSEIFNVSGATISRILSGLRWSSVTNIKYNKDNSILF